MSITSKSAPEGLRMSRDAHGVPQIHGDDLTRVHWGMGYCHMMDRGLQMLLMRALGQGRAAELLDGSDEMVEIDRFFRRMNWAGASAASQGAELEGEARRAVEAYCDGVNARMREKVPWELKLVGMKPEPWQLADCVLIARMMGYLTLAQSQGEIERLLVEMVQAGIEDEYLEALFPGCTRSLDREIINKVKLGARVVPSALKWLSSAPTMMASNNWVISGELSSSGAAMLGNDPHLETNRLPNVWCELSVRWDAGYALLATVPGLPGPLVGRTERVAWGATYTFMDAVDSWVEECRDNKFRRGDEWVEFDRRVETIKRKKGPDVEVVFWENEHGTLDGDPAREGFYLATRWSAASSGAASLSAAFGMWSVTSVEEAMGTIGEIESAFNWVLADDEGNIGYQMSGLMPLRHEGWNGLFPAPGWDPEYDWRGFAALEDLPRAFNPPEGYIVTANQDLNALGKLAPINMPMGDYRARRIAERLESRTDHDVASFQAIQMDVHSIQAREFMPLLEPLLDEGPAAKALAEWDLEYTPRSVGASAFEAFYRELLVEMFGGRFGTEVARYLADATGVFIDFYQDFDRLLVADSSPWHSGRERDDIWRAALERVRNTEPKTWGEVNAIPLTNIFFSGKLPAFLGFDHRPIPLRGGRATPHQGQVYVADGRQTSFTPSLRLVADMSERGLHTALCGGPSDRRFSGLYVSGVAGWLEGELKQRSAP